MVCVSNPNLPTLPTPQLCSIKNGHTADRKNRDYAITKYIITIHKITKRQEGQYPYCI